MNYYYIIQGLEVDGELTYWSNEDGWVSCSEATKFTKKEINTIAFPIEAVCVIKVDEDGRVVDTKLISDILGK